MSPIVIDNNQLINVTSSSLLSFFVGSGEMNHWETGDFGSISATHNSGSRYNFCSFGPHLIELCFHKAAASGNAYRNTLSVERVFSWKNETLRTPSLQADATLDGVKYETTLRNQMKRTAAGRTEGRGYPNWRGEWGINNLCRDEWFFLLFSFLQKQESV